MPAVSSSGSQGATKLEGLRSDLASVTVLLAKVEKPDVGFLGTVTSGKLPKVNEKPTVTSIWAVMLAEKMTTVFGCH